MASRPAENDTSPSAAPAPGADGAAAGEGGAAANAGNNLDVSTASTPLQVPVFNCLVYVAHGQGGAVRARVANLDGLSCEAASEREALGKIVPEFKRRVAALTESGTSIPWIDPPPPAAPDEQSRFIPVHL